MTASPDSPPQVFSDIEDAIRSLRESGLRLSTARRLVLEALFASEGPVAAAHLARSLSLDESSVYRNLEVLEQRGLVRHLHLGHSPGLYVLVSERELEYLYCEWCAKVTPVAPERVDPIREQIHREFGHTPKFTHFAIVGICEECAAATSSGGRTAASAPRRRAPASRRRERGRAGEPEHLHSHGEYVHSHPDQGEHTH